MSTASVGRTSIQHPINVYLQSIYRQVMIFSDATYLDGLTIRSKDSLLDDEVIELRNFSNTIGYNPLLECTPGQLVPAKKTGVITSGDPSSSETPLSVGLLIFATTKELSESVLVEHTGNITSNELVFSIPNTSESNFDWLLRPNLLRFPGGAEVLGGTSYTFAVDTPGPGQTEITVQDVVSSDGNFTFRPIGLELAIVDEFTGGTISPGSPIDIRFDFSYGSVEEVSY